MRKFLLTGTAVALLVGCAPEQPKKATEELQTFDVEGESPPPDAVPTSPYAPPPPPAPPPPAVSPPPLVREDRNMSVADGAGPNIGVTAAPGVAFAYRHAFRLANARIQAVQEAHAQMCEKLTVARCRITGLRYAVVGDGAVSASLEMKLDPAIARQFGKDATKVVTDAKGMLVDLAISGTDMGSTIASADRGRAELSDELARVERELNRAGQSSVVRDRLLSEAQQLRGQIRGLGEQKRSAEETLATTPMAFYYGSGDAVPGFEEEQPPIASALERAGDSFQGAVGFLIVAAATLLPWALLIGLLVWLWRRLGVGTWLQQRSDEAFAREA